MFKTVLSAVTVIVLATISNSTSAQDFNAMNAAFNQQQNAQMQAMTNNIVYTNMHDPNVQQQYRELPAAVSSTGPSGTTVFSIC